MCVCVCVCVCVKDVNKIKKNPHKTEFHGYDSQVS